VDMGDTDADHSQLHQQQHPVVMAVDMVKEDVAGAAVAVDVVVVVMVVEVDFRVVLW